MKISKRPFSRAASPHQMSFSGLSSPNLFSAGTLDLGVSLSNREKIVAGPSFCLFASQIEFFCRNQHCHYPLPAKTRNSSSTTANKTKQTTSAPSASTSPSSDTAAPIQAA